MPEELVAEPVVHSEIDSTSSPDLRSFKPFVPQDVTLRELTPLSIVFGIFSGLILGTASLYMLLKTGLSVTSSIAIAVLSITLFKTLSRLGLRNPSILEHNIAQSAGSAGDSVAYGIAITIPASLVLGGDLNLLQVVLVTLVGAVLGIFLMIPLRRQFVASLHGQLKYPEAIATAKIAETLVDKGGGLVLLGAGISAMYYVLMSIFKAWRDITEKVFGQPFDKASVAMETSPVLVAAGYIIGPRVAATMCAGGIFSSMVLNPLIHFFGQGSINAMAPGAVPIASMNHYQLRGAYVIYIGAGAMVAAGIISLARALSGLWENLKQGLADLRGNANSFASLKPPANWFQSQLERGHCLVMLDGLDEVADFQERTSLTPLTLEPSSL